ncbi:anti sigma factor C-terminal domain-containing protein [Virgibacillus ndiopensis]|uniref:anti sigma factor C-terminal domain-containing protein n=1 Tax=Virgibacillus ndiopensis TaxID=2004408 RepID=UPI00159B8F47|nr:anti sigma factor C-terminal domain-containing protein [Virgibacillus ndiopensis]
MRKDNVIDEWNEDELESFDKKKAKKLVWRTRLSISFTVIRTICIIGFLYLLYIIPVSVFYDMSGKQAEFDRLVTTLVESRIPGVSVDKTLLGRTAEINPLLTQHTTLTLYRNVGEWDVVIGEVEAKKRLFGKVNYSIHYEKEYLHDNNSYNFAVAPDLLGKSVSNDNSKNSQTLWKQLEKIEDGYVAQVHFSTKKGMDPEELLSILSNYDLRVLQLPVYAGEINAIDVGYGRAGQFTFVSSLLLRPMQSFDKENRISSYNNSLRSVDLRESIDQFYKNIKWLVKNGAYHGKEIDKKRLAFLQENGMKVFGATITGPIREIEKLQNEKLFHQYYLDGIEVWNWDN